MRYYISDLHYYHKSLLGKMDKRPFETIEQMHEYMISQWNKKVRKNDDVVVLGDFSFGSAKETMEILKQLNGNIYLIIGNHDHKFLKDKNFDSTLFKWIKPYEELHDNKRKVVLSHYPVFCYNGQYRIDGNGIPTTYMLYGHVHNTTDYRLLKEFINITKQTEVVSSGKTEPTIIPCQMINCFCMFSDYMPLSLDEWIALQKIL